MKKCFRISVIVLSVSLLLGDGYTEVWKNTNLFESGDYDPIRGVVWNPHTDYLLVVTRSGSYPRVLVMDPETGGKLGVLDTSGLSKITTEEGIGSDVSAMKVKVYLADMASDGEVLASFPDNGETGNGVSFTSYYRFDDVGQGVYPAFDVEKVGAGTVIAPKTIKTPDGFRLAQNYPNPFNPVTQIRYELPQAGEATLQIYDLKEHQVADLVREFQGAGQYRVSFDGKDLASGIYLYQLKVDDRIVAIRKMVLLK